MRYISIAVVALCVSAGMSFAQGASQKAPGQRQVTPGAAKNYAPGQRQTTPGSAKKYAPGQQSKK